VTYPQDFDLSNFHINPGSDLIDTYELIESVFNKKENLPFNYLLDYSLPLIKGDINLLKKILEDFIDNSINEFKGYNGTLNLVFRKDYNHSIIIYFTKELPSTELGTSCLVDTIQELNLAICTKI